MPKAPLKSIRSFSTGAAEQHREHRYGTRLPRTMWALLSRSWVEVPISVFVLEHRDGLVLFDTGLDPAISSDPNYISSAVGRFFLRKVFRLRIGPEDSLSRNLERLAFSPSDVRKVVFSHLHFDHIGGIREVSPQAELLVSQKEWLQLAKRHPERDWILREHIELPNTRWRQVEFVRTDEEVLAAFGVSHDVMGDGSMVLLPTPGHTPGSMSLLVRSAGHPPLLFVGDLTYDPELLMRDQVPGVYSDRAELKASFAKVRALKEVLPDLLVLGSHDPAAATALASASAQCSSRASGSGE